MNIVFMERDTLGEDIDLSAFEQFGTVTTYGKSDPLLDASRIKDADIIVVNKIPMNEKTLCMAEKLKLICITATGTNIVDFNYTNARGIEVRNVKAYSTDSVVQHTFALLFYVYEKLSFYDEFVKSGKYARYDIFSNFTERFHELAGKTWGIIGLGNIGRGVAKVCEAFGMRVIYYSTSGKNSNGEYERVELDELLEQADIISIHAPLNEKTEGLLSYKEFDKMKESVVLLNLGRGPIIDEEALADALIHNKIQAAGLDVLSVEPMLETNPLMQIKDSKKLIITPHIAWASVEARSRLMNEIYKNMKAFLNGEERNVVCL